MPDPRVVFVDVYIDDPTTDPPQFRVVPSRKNPDQLPTKPNPVNPGRPEIIFHNNGNPGFNIHFELKGNTHGYFFPTTEEEIPDAVWSKCGSECPAEGRVHEVFEPRQVEETGYPPEPRILIVHNRNPGPPPGQRKFKYNLRVTNGTDWKNLDPPGDNTNGSYVLYSYGTAETMLVAGVVATAAFLAVDAFDFLDDSNASLGIALLAALTIGFAIAALWERLRRS